MPVLTKKSWPTLTMMPLHALPARDRWPNTTSRNLLKFLIWRQQDTKPLSDLKSGAFAVRTVEKWLSPKPPSSRKITRLPLQSNRKSLNYWLRSKPWQILPTGSQSQLQPSFASSRNSNLKPTGRNCQKSWAGMSITSRKGRWALPASVLSLSGKASWSFLRSDWGGYFWCSPDFSDSLSDFPEGQRQDYQRLGTPLLQRQAGSD